jgi:adenylyltransferase/sulfurtransferase
LGTRILDDIIMILTTQEKTYYDRQLLLSGFGEAAQLKLKNASVAIVGAGGLGCPASLYLSASGVGRIGIIDHDVVHLSNLHRQVLYNTEDVGKSKAMLAKLKLSIRNPHIQIDAYEVKLNTDNAFELLMPFDYILDASDNFATRYLINDICVKTDKPFISGSLFQFQGQLACFNVPISEHERSGTYRCLFPLPPSISDAPGCNEIGVIGAVAGITGTMMANETIKLITGIGQALVNRYAVLDFLHGQFQIFSYEPNKPEIERLKNTPLEEEAYYQNLCNTNLQNKSSVASISAEELKSYIRHKENIFLIDVREPNEHELLNIGGVNIPLKDLRSRFFEVPRDKKVVVYCQTGKRSLEAINYLQVYKGFTNLLQLQGGIRSFMNTK